jgi:DamX protein
MNSSATPHTASPAYLQTFSLNCDPFEGQLDPRFFYAGTALVQRLDLLAHLTQFGDSLAIVSGPPGSGKSTLLSRFVAQANREWRLCVLSAREFDEFPSRLAAATGAETIASEQDLITSWANTTDASQLLVIAIDDAEQLDQAVVERLSQLLTSPEAERLRLILFCTPDAQQPLKQALERKSPSSTVQVLEIPRLSEEETASYLMYRLAVAGYSGESPFTATEVRAICKAADGRPAMINKLAHDALVEHHARSTSKPVRPAPRKRKRGGLAWGVASLVLILAAAYLGWQRLDTPPTVVEQQPLARAPEPELPLELPKPETRSAPPVANLVAPAPSAESGPVASEAQLTSAEAADGAAETETAAVESSATAPDTPASPQAEDTAPRTTATVAAKRSESLVAQAPPTEQTGGDTETEPPPPTEPGELESLPDRAGEQTPPAPPGPDSSPVEPEPQPETLPHRETWLLQQPGQSFSLQLLGSRSEKSVTEFIDQHKLDPEQSAFYRGIYKDAEWYVLMYGIFPSREAALQARNELPQKVRDNKPWPRSLESVHAAIRKAQ